MQLLTTTEKMYQEISLWNLLEPSLSIEHTKFCSNSRFTADDEDICRRTHTPYLNWEEYELISQNFFGGSDGSVYDDLWP